jgi:hypothetical protein
MMLRLRYRLWKLRALCWVLRRLKRHAGRNPWKTLTTKRDAYARLNVTGRIRLFFRVQYLIAINLPIANTNQECPWTSKAKNIRVLNA